MSCDVCKATDGELYQLLECYRSDGIGHVCFACLQIINSHQRKLREVTHNILVAWVKRYIRRLAGRGKP